MLGIKRACLAAFLITKARAHKLMTSNGIRGFGDDLKSEPTVDLKTSNSEGENVKITYEPVECTLEGRKELPFVITDVKGDHDGDLLSFGYGSTEFPDDIYLLKDVVYCPLENYIITGTKVSSDEFKAAVKDYLEANHLDAVLYNIHGMNTEPYSSFVELGVRFTEEWEHLTHYLFIPVIWRMGWDIGRLSYEYDRNNYSIQAGKLLAQHAEVFDADYTTHVMCHSQGNWVFRNLAQTIATPQQFFDNIFMVGADARSDMFADGFNPDAPRTNGERTREKQIGVNLKDDIPIWQCVYENSDARVKVGSGEATSIPEEECKLNGGYDITKLGNHVHVIWNQDDEALAMREWLQMGAGDGLMQALGKWGERAEGYMNLQYFKDRVTFHNFTGYASFVDSHSYQLERPAIEVYDPRIPQHRAVCEWTSCGFDQCPEGQDELTWEYCHNTWSLRDYKSHCCMWELVA